MIKRFILPLIIFTTIFASACTGSPQTNQSDPPTTVSDSSEVSETAPSPNGTLETEPDENNDEPDENSSEEGYEESKLSINDVEDIFKNYYSIAADLAPDEIATTIKSQNNVVPEESDNLRDFKFQCGNSVLHFYVDVLGDSSGNIQFVHGLIRADDTAPYYLAALLALHKGVSEERALTEATELISNVGVEDANPVSNDFYNTVIKEVYDYYYLLSGFLTPYSNDDFYSDRIDANSAKLVVYAATSE